MAVLVDIGNTRLKWAVNNGRNFVATGVIDTESVGSDISVPVAVTNALKNHTSVWISSVAATEVVTELCEKWFSEVEAHQLHLIIVGKKALELTNEYLNPDQLGVDRWVAAIGARHLYNSGDLIIVDAGTAVTIDWLDNQNRFQGGVILPGPYLMHEALVGRTAGIKSEFEDARQIVGKTTSECVNSGVTYGLIGAIERVIGEMQTTIQRPTTIVLTGGAAEAIIANSITPFDLQEALVLFGLLALSLDGG